MKSRKKKEPGTEINEIPPLHFQVALLNKAIIDARDAFIEGNLGTQQELYTELQDIWDFTSVQQLIWKLQAAADKGHGLDTLEGGTEYKYMHLRPRSASKNIYRAYENQVKAPIFNLHDGREFSAQEVEERKLKVGMHIVNGRSVLYYDGGKEDPKQPSIQDTKLPKISWEDLQHIIDGLMAPGPPSGVEGGNGEAFDAIVMHLEREFRRLRITGPKKIDACMTLLGFVATSKRRGMMPEPAACVATSKRRGMMPEPDACVWLMAHAMVYGKEK